MKFILNDKEISLSELKNILYNEIDPGPPDGGDFEFLEIDDVDVENEIIYLNIFGASNF